MKEAREGKIVDPMQNIAVRGANTKVIDKPDKSTDKQLPTIKRIELYILKCAQGKFTGKLRFDLNLSQGGITGCDVQIVSKLS